MTAATMGMGAADGLPPAQRLPAMATVILAVGLASLDTAIANTALPTIAADLAASPASSIWVVNAYQLALVISLLPLAALGEIVGFRRIFMGGLMLFVVASLFCAASRTLPELAAARVLQGLGASGVMSVNTALIRSIYPARQLGRGLGFNAMVVAVSTAVGPSVASGILSVATWQWLFAVNVPLGLAALGLAVRALPARPGTGAMFDRRSAALNAATFGLLVLGIGEAGQAAAPVVVLAEIAAAMVAGVFLVRRQISLPAPMLPVDLFRRPVFALSAATSFCSFAAQGLAFVALPFYFETVLGFTAVQTGLLLTPWPVVTGLLAPVAGNLSDRYNPGMLGGFGLAGLCVGLALMAGLPAHPQVWDIVWRMAVCGGGFGFFQSPNLRALMASAPPARSGGASGIVATARLMGQTVGAALVALCFNISAAHGPVLALALGAGFAAAASLVSFVRLLAPSPIA